MLTILSFLFSLIIDVLCLTRWPSQVQEKEAEKKVAGPDRLCKEGE